jgi:hypothetical protein
MATAETGLATFDLPSTAIVERRLAAIQDFQTLIRSSLKIDHDFGTIPGTQKPTLLKPGAEKIAKLLDLADTYEIIESTMDWDRPLIAYTIKCQLIAIATGGVIAEGLGECNSYEAKYRWRQGERTCPECRFEGAIIKGKKEYGGGWLCWGKKEGCGAKFNDGDQAIESQVVDRVENPDIFDQKNTILKMGKKRSLVDAALSVGRLSDLFTQDMEELRPQAAVVDAEGRAEGAPATAPDATESDVMAPAESTGTSIGSAGELMTRVQRIYGAGRTVTAGDVCRVLGVEGPRDIADLDAAWRAIGDAWGEVPA